MAYLLRVLLPDRPGSLGALAGAVGAAGGDIVSLDVVERGAHGAVDDILVELPGGLADTLITAAHSIPGVVVESLRPYVAGQEIHRDLELVDLLASEPERALEVLVEHAPGVFRAGWALLVESAPRSADGEAGAARVLAGSAGTPDISGVSFPWLPLATSRRLERAWIPERWDLLGMELAAAPVGDPARAVLLGRPGGPRFRAGEVLRLTHLAGIAATVSRRQSAGRTAG